MLALIPLLALAAPALAHMQMTYPAPFRSKSNSFVPETSIDYSMTTPLLATGANYPCKGYQVDMGTAMGAATAGWTQGGSYNFTVEGTAIHGGGSCQASLSYDGGNTFKVIKSWIGNCPVEGSGNFDFAVPSDAPSGDAVFAWTWFNNIGNREMYMNCAHVTIASGSGSSKRSDVASYSSAPANFIANVGNGCSTEAGKDVLFPAPGSVVVDTSAGTAAPIGTCGAAGSADTSSSSSASSDTSSSAAAAASSSSSSSSASAGNNNLAATSGSTDSTASSSPTAAATTTDAAAPAGTSSAGTSKCQRKRKVKRALSPEAKRAIAEIEARDFAAQDSAAVYKRNMPAYAAEEAKRAADNHSANRVRRMGNIHGKRRFE